MNILSIGDQKDVAHLANTADPLDVKAFKNDPTPTIEKLYRGLTAPIRLLPDFLIIGTQKGGTTSLYNYLQYHSSIASAVKKEVHFFDRSNNLKNGLLWYQAHFPTLVEKYDALFRRKLAFLTGESTPEYLFLPHVPMTVFKVTPRVKLIALLRNPIDRSYSQYQHAVVEGHETRSFEEAIAAQEATVDEERVRILSDENYEPYRYIQRSYLTRSIYIDQLQNWMDVFPREQFLILRSEDFYTHPAAITNQVLGFLNLPTLDIQTSARHFKPYNYNKYSKMARTQREHMAAFFKPYNAQLYDFLNVDFGWD